MGSEMPVQDFEVRALATFPEAGFVLAAGDRITQAESTFSAHDDVQEKRARLCLKISYLTPAPFWWLLGPCPCIRVTEILQRLEFSP